MNRLKFTYEVEEFCCECSLVNDAVDTLTYIHNQKYGDYSSVAIIANEDLTEKIMKCVLAEFNVNVEYINFDKADYGDAYGINFIMENGELTFSIEEAMGKNMYKMFDVDYLYVEKSVNKAFLRRNMEYETDIDVFKITEEC